MRREGYLLSGSLIHIFRTEKGSTYIYDACNSAIYPVRGPDLPIIRKLQDPKSIDDSGLLKRFSLVDVEKARKKILLWRKAEGAFFPSHDLKTFDFMPKADYLRKHENLAQLILETTQRCNLRCKYCIYRDDYAKARSYSTVDMTWEIAKRSIDYYVERLNSPYRTSLLSRKMKAPLSFYGGEPLLNVSLIERCVEYIRKRHLEDRIYFNMTTNGTLIDKEMANFLIKNDFTLLISLDGPQEEQDRNRVYSNGKGTFANLIRIIRMIYSLNKNYFKRKVSFNTVYTYDSNLKKIINFYSRLSRELGGNVRTKISLDNSEIGKTANNVKNLRRQFGELNNIYFDFRKFGHTRRKSREYMYQLEQLVGNDYIRLSERNYDEPEKSDLQAGVCTPGERRLYVDVYGNFHMCERISHDFPIGDCWGGINYKTITEVYEKFKRSILDECNDCIAMNRCSICYATVGINGGEFRREGHCMKARQILIYQLKTYLSILETNPAAFETKPFKEDI